MKIISDIKTALGHDAMDELVSSVVPTSEGIYEWHLLTKPDKETSVNLAVKGRANSKERTVCVFIRRGSGQIRFRCT